MAQRKYYIGSQGPFYFDDADLIDDPDGDFAGETQGGLITDGAVQGVTISGDLTDDEAIHHSDFSLNGVMVRTGSETYSIIQGESVDESFTVVSGLQAGGGGAIGLQYRTRTITLDDGVITDVSAESSWSDL